MSSEVMMNRLDCNFWGPYALTAACSLIPKCNYPWSSASLFTEGCKETDSNVCVSCVFFLHWHSNYQETLYKTSNTWALNPPLQNWLSFLLLLSLQTLWYLTSLLNLRCDLSSINVITLRSTLASQKCQSPSESVVLHCNYREVTKKSLHRNSGKCSTHFL